MCTAFVYPSVVRFRRVSPSCSADSAPARPLRCFINTARPPKGFVNDIIIRTVISRGLHSIFFSFVILVETKFSFFHFGEHTPEGSLETRIQRASSSLRDFPLPEMTFSDAFWYLSETVSCFCFKYFSFCVKQP